MTDDIVRKFDAIIERLSGLVEGPHKRGHLEFTREIYVEARRRCELYPLLLEQLQDIDGLAEDPKATEDLLRRCER